MSVGTVLPGLTPCGWRCVQSSIFQRSCLLAGWTFPLSCPESDQNQCTWSKLSFLHCKNATESQSWSGWGWKAPLEVFLPSAPSQGTIIQSLLPRMVSRQFWVCPGMEHPQPPWATCASAQLSSQWESFVQFVCQFVPIASGPLAATEALALSSTHSPFRHIYTSVKGSLSLFLYERCSSLIIFMVFHKSLSSMSLSLLQWGTENWTQPFKGGHCRAEGKGGLPWLAGSIPAITAQDSVSLSCHRDTSLACFPLG